MKDKMHIAVFCGSSMPHNKEIVEAAAALGHRIAQDGHTLVYGGSNLGLMGTISGAAMENGGRVVAVIPTFFSEEIINSQTVTELVRVRSMAERKEYLIANSDAFIALPGGIGTLDEVLEVMVYNQLGPLSNKDHKDKPIILYNPDGFYDCFLGQIEMMGKHGFFRSGRAPQILTASSIDHIIELL